MTRRTFAALLICVTAALPARGAGTLIERLATCQDSWYDGKDDPAKMKALAETFNRSFKQKDKEPGFVPTTKILVAGLQVVQAFPESVGMAVGFSVVLDANFDKARSAIEKAVGKSLQMCDTGDGMRACELQIAEKRSLNSLHFFTLPLNTTNGDELDQDAFISR